MQPINENEILFIINPNSGKRNSGELLAEIKKHAPNIETLVTRDLEDLANTFNLNSGRNKAFVVVGGDGTVNGSIPFLVGQPDKLLAVLPSGSGNGFARELGFKGSLHELISDLKKGETVNVDVLKVNEKYCINTAGLGFDSKVAHDFHQRTGRGFWNYVISTLHSVFAFRPFEATITMEGKSFSGKFQMITMANTRQFGNNAIIAPMANPTDGNFELVLVKPFPVYLYPAFIIRMFRGKLKTNKYIEYISVQNSAEIKSDFKNYHIDGEPKIFENNVKIEMIKEKVRVLKTRNCKW